MSKKTVAVTALTGLVAGIIIGSSGSAESDTQPVAQPEPKIKTITKTNTVTEIQAPQSCLKAIHTSETIMADLVPQMLDITSSYIDLVPKAARAGLNQDVSAMYDVRDRITELTDDTNDVRGLLAPLSRRFKTNRDLCESAS